MSNFAKRTIIGIIGMPLILLTIYVGGLYFLIFSVLVNIAGLWEFYNMFEKKQFNPLKVLSVFCSCIIMLCYFFYPAFIWYVLILIFTLIISAEAFRQKHNPLNIFISMFSFYYVTFALILLNELLKHPYFNPVLYIIILIWTCDIFAYLGGMLFGKHKMTKISPKKTWEGAVTGFVVTICASFIFRIFYPGEISIADAAALGLIVGILGQAGDIFESFLKRYAGIKDSSTIIPGHGGILDRFDSLIFIAPIGFVYFSYFKQFIN